MKFYTGDIVTRDVEYLINKQTYRWGTECYAIVSDIQISGYTLFYRPFKNHLKAIFKLK
jgi:hypothetical protein